MAAPIPFAATAFSAARTSQNVKAPPHRRYEKNDEQQLPRPSTHCPNPKTWLDSH